jgi:hypothetical protein
MTNMQSGNIAPVRETPIGTMLDVLSQNIGILEAKTDNLFSRLERITLLTNAASMAEPEKVTKTGSEVYHQLHGLCERIEELTNNIQRQIDQLEI